MDVTNRQSEVLKKYMISNHEQRRTACYRDLELIGDARAILTLTQSEAFDMKPSRPSVSPHQLTPVHCQSLAPNTIHVSRVLRGILVVSPHVMKAAHSIIEDEAGGIVRASFYNFAPDGLSFTQLASIAESLLPIGKKVAIVEPYYKYAQDGTLIVRVDNFAEDVIFPDHLGPSCSEGWRAEAKVHFANQQFQESIFCYRRSIETHDNSKLAAVLLSNIASCLLKKELYSASLFLAVASLAVCNSFFRPFYTAGFCLNSLNRKDLAFNCLEQCRTLNAPSAPCRQLEQLLDGTTNKRILASEWNARVLCLVASETLQPFLHINPNDVVDSKTLKENGNELFNMHQYDEAIKEYCNALRGIPEVAQLLANKSLCYSKIGNYSETALHASAAILVAPNNAKAHYWKSFSLLQLNLKEEARTSCDAALQIIRGNADQKALKERVKCACLASYVSKSKKEASEERNLLHQNETTERRQEEELRKHNMSTASVSMINKMLESLGLSHATDDRVKPFHLEFSRRGKWPPECDTHLGMELLTRGYENARAREHVHRMSFESASLQDFMRLSKRLNSTDVQVHQWWFRAPFRSLSPRKRNPYSSKMCHSFTNSSCRAKTMLIGAVHVSVGFVDLSELLFCMQIPAEQIGPMRWIGYEASAYSVAKSMVIAHMLRHQANTDCILQVWYSSSWSMSTLGSFRKALREMLNGTDATAYSSEVVSLLEHWQQFDVTLRTARSEWLERHSLCNHVEIANFRREIDRFAVCHYLLSGDILKGEVGSVAMFGLPSTEGGKKYEIALDEWFWHCLPNQMLVKELDTKTSYVDAAIHLLRKQVSELKKLVSNGEVVIEIRHKGVTMSEKGVIREIRKLSPQSISWSNLCDYYSNEEFHRMTRACSTSDTTHYVSSMNWSTEIKGTFMMDYSTEAQEEFLREANNRIGAWYQISGLIDYLHAPPITHYYNIGAHHLCHMLKETWTEHFFKAAGLKDAEKQTLIEFVDFNVLARTSNTIDMAYTFNADKQLNILHY